MPVAFFQVPLSVKPKSGGKAEIVLPEVLHDFDCVFVIVKEGAAEGIVRVDAPKPDLAKIATSANCTPLTPKAMKALYQSYPRPKLKEQYKTKPPVTPTSQEPAPGMAPSPVPPPPAIKEEFETDEQGHPIVLTLQTVRAAFYIIDVPIVTEPVIQ